MSLIREESIRAMGGEVNAEAMKGLAINLEGQDIAAVL